MKFHCSGCAKCTEMFTTGEQCIASGRECWCHQKDWRKKSNATGSEAAQTTTTNNKWEKDFQRFFDWDETWGFNEADKALFRAQLLDIKSFIATQIAKAREEGKREMSIEAFSVAEKNWFKKSRAAALKEILEILELFERQLPNAKISTLKSTIEKKIV